MTRQRPASWSGRLAAAARAAVTLVVGGVGAAAGFTHTHDWALRHGQAGWLAWADAIVIECLVVVASIELRRDHRRARRPVSFPLMVMLAGLGVQMTAQVALAEPSVAGWIVAAMPAASFVVVVKLMLRRTPNPTTTAEPVTPAVETPAPERVDTTLSTPPASTPVPTAAAGFPLALTDKARAAVAEARADGREPIADDIRRATRVPLPLAQRMLHNLIDN